VTVYDKDVPANEKLGTKEVALKDLIKNNPPGKKISATETYVLDCGKMKPQRSGNATVTIEFQIEYYTASDCVELETKKNNEKRESSKGFFDQVLDHAEKTITGTRDGDWQLGQPVFQKYELRVHLYLARSLPPLDRNGLCDPFVVIKLCGSKIKSPKRKETLNPQWYQSFKQEVTLPTFNNGCLEMAPPVQIVVYDWDFLTKNDFVGSLSLSCQDIVDENKKVGFENLKPKWHKLKTYDGKDSESEILIYLQLLNVEQQCVDDFKMPLDIQPDILPDLELEVTTLGMRDLVDPLGIQKTKIDFELPDGQKYGTNVSVLPTVNNPNFLQILKFPINIPKKKIFKPILNITVRDVLWGGKITRRIGCADVMLSDYMEEKDGILTVPIRAAIFPRNVSVFLRVGTPLEREHAAGNR